MVQVVWVDGRTKELGCTQVTGFITIHGGVDRGVTEGVIVRWMDKSSLSRNADHGDRPICDYPLDSNHCLWEWSKTDVNRGCFGRGFMNRFRREHLWSHVKEQHRSDVIRSEIRARYDIVSYDSIVSHVNVHKDPSTGHMLQTLQIV